MPYHYCNCEDWPCCGHGSGAAGGGLDPEDSVEWLDDMDEEEREWTEQYMTPCPECGEMRPRTDPVLLREGMCHMCTQDDQRRRSPVASNNLRFFHQREAAKDDRIAELEAEVERLREQLGE